MEALPAAPPPPRWPPPELPPWVLVLLIPATLLGYVVVQGTLQLLNLGLALWFTEVFVFLAIPWFLARLREEDPVDVARARWPGWAPIGWGAAVGVANYFGAVIPLQLAAQKLFPKEWVELFDMSHLFERQDAIDMALLLAAVSVAAPFCEELFFRGFLQERLTRTLGAPWRVTVFVAVVFSAFHLDPVGFVSRFELGLLFGLLYWRLGSLWPGVMAHAANNVTSTALFLLARSQGAQDEAEPEGRVVLILLGVGLPVLLVLLRFALRARVRPAPPPSRQPLRAGAVWPWPLAGMAAIALVLALDLRGVQLNLIDARVRLPAEGRDADEHEEALRDELSHLRSSARRGRASLDEYEEKRRELAELLRLKEDD
ncbi:MAG TPA: type II CAAX endopeptidase family protein [Myxococcales bacterium]|nr:type II CAAX endopeptidase family protein [Myxococcales bacterium]